MFSQEILAYNIDINLKDLHFHLSFFTKGILAGDGK
jgi:hypothetical protein